MLKIFQRLNKKPSVSPLKKGGGTFPTIFCNDFGNASLHMMKLRYQYF